MRYLAIFIGMILALVAAALLALRSEPTVLATADWAVNTFTDLRLDLRNPRVNVYQGRFSADEIHLLPKQSEGPALFSVLGFSASITPGELFGGPLLRSSLEAGSILIYVSDSDEAADPAPIQWLGYLGWLPEQLRVAQVHLVTASANTWIFPLKDLRGDRLEHDRYRLSAAADYEGEPLGIELDLLAVKRGWGVVAAATQIKLSAPQSGSEATLAGDLEGTREIFHYNFKLSAFYQDVGEFLKGVEGGPDLVGTLRLQGTLQGDTRGFTLNDANFLLDNSPNYVFEANGKLAYTFGGSSSLDLLATGELDSLDYLVDWIDLDIGDLGGARSSIRLGGSLEKPVIESIELDTSSTAGLTVHLSGKLDLFNADSAAEPVDNAVQVTAQGPNLQVLQQWLGEVPYDIGPWRARGEVAGNRDKLAIRDIVVETGAPGELEIRASGLIGSITPPGDGAENYEITGIQLELEASMPDSAGLAALLDMPVPPLHSISARAALAGSGQKLKLTDGAVTISSSDLQASIGPVSGLLKPAAEQVLSGLVAPVQLQLSDTSALSQYTNQAVPVLGPLQLTARVVQKGKVFQLQDIVASVAEGTTTITVHGQIPDLSGLPAAELAAEFHLSDRDSLAALTGLPLNPVSGSLTVSSTQGEVRSVLKALVGATRLNGTGVVAFSGDTINSAALILDTPHLHLADLGLQAAPEPAKAAPQEKAEGPGPLARLKSNSPPFPIDLQLNIEEISGTNSHIDSLQVQLTGADMRYTLARFSAIYGQARAEIRGIIDLNPEPPALSLAGEAQALPLSAILEDVGIKTNVKGALTVLGGVTVMGDTSAELVSNLNGSVAFALEDAVIEGAAYDLLATDLLAWIYSGALTEKSTRLACTMARFEMRQGVATSDSLYIESARMVATGTAEFDLVKQRMDVRITPLSKSRSLQVPSRVRLKGPMSDPKAEISPISAVADATSAAIMLIPDLTMKLFGMNKSSAKSRRPCQASLGN